MSRFSKPDKTFTQDLSADELDYTTDYGKAFQVTAITFNFSGVVSETITITVDTKAGANYDWLVKEIVLVSEEDYTFRPDNEFVLLNGDELRIQCTNTGGSEIVYGTVKTVEAVR